MGIGTDEADIRGLVIFSVNVGSSCCSAHRVIGLGAGILTP